MSILVLYERLTAGESVTRSRIRQLTTARVAALLGTLALTGCSDSSGPDPSGPGLETYQVIATSLSSTVVQEDGTMVSQVNLKVYRGDSTVVGASLAYTVSQGTLSSATGMSDATGFAGVTWTVTPAQYAGQTEVTFQACADNQKPAACTAATVLTIHLGT